MHIFVSSPCYVFLGVFATLPLSLLIEKSLTLVLNHVFLGFKPHTKGYFIYNLYSRSFEVSRNVTFYENFFPYVQPNNDFSHSSNTPFSNTFILSPLAYVDVPFPSHDTLSSSNIAPHNSASQPSSSQPLVPLRRSTRRTQQPAFLRHYHIAFTSTGIVPSPGIHYPLSNFLSYDNLSSSYCRFVLSISYLTEPTS